MTTKLSVLREKDVRKFSITLAPEPLPTSEKEGNGLVPATPDPNEVPAIRDASLGTDGFEIIEP